MHIECQKFKFKNQTSGYDPKIKNLRIKTVVFSLKISNKKTFCVLKLLIKTESYYIM